MSEIDYTITRAFTVETHLSTDKPTYADGRIAGVFPFTMRIPGTTYVAHVKRLKTSNRVELIEKYGYDTKFAYHIVRLSLQVEQILEKHDMDFSANAPFIKEVRKGAFKTVEELEAWYREKEVHLNALYHTSTLRHSPDMAQLKEVLMACLEMKYGSLEKVYKGAESDVFRKLEEIKRIVNS